MVVEVKEDALAYMVHLVSVLFNSRPSRGDFFSINKRHE